MRTIFLILVAVVLAATIAAQVPQKMSYQAIIRNDKDSLVRNQSIGLRISILQGTVNGNEVFIERYNPLRQTNMNGLVTVEIGTGYPITGRFSDIDWSNGPYFIKTEIDPTGTSDYSIISTSQLLSVPYALHAKTAESVVGDVATKAYVDAVLARVEVIEKQLNIVPDSVFIDARDGTEYKMVKIGKQIWMAENLKYLPDSSKFVISNTEPYYSVNVWSENVNETKDVYGVLYNWPAAINGATSSNSNPSGVQGVCPAGWHLPSYSEWSQLVDYLGGEDSAGSKLKEFGTAHWNSPNIGATNESGFNALPGGAIDIDWSAPVGNFGLWWSSSWNNQSPTDYFPSLDYNSNMVQWGKYKGCCNIQDYKSFGLSVRCVKD